MINLKKFITMLENYEKGYEASASAEKIQGGGGGAMERLIPPL